MIKPILIFIFVVCCFVVTAGEVAYIEEDVNKRGDKIIRAKSTVDYVIYCTLSGLNFNRYFAVQPFETSRWYLKPSGGYILECK